MIKKLAISFILLCFAMCIFGCNNAEEQLPTNDGNKPSDTVDSAQDSIAGSDDVVSDTVQSEEAEPVDEKSYVGALTEQQKSDVVEFAKSWYGEHFAEKKVKEISFADDDHSAYDYYAHDYSTIYKPGEIIILKVQLSGSKPPRDCIIAISESGYEVINEGY